MIATQVYTANGNHVEIDGLQVIVHVDDTNPLPVQLFQDIPHDHGGICRILQRSLTVI